MNILFNYNSVKYVNGEYIEQPIIDEDNLNEVECETEEESDDDDEC